jgi:hypothetical protein
MWSSVLQPWRGCWRPSTWTVTLSHFLFKRVLFWWVLSFFLQSLCWYLGDSLNSQTLKRVWPIAPKRGSTRPFSTLQVYTVVMTIKKPPKPRRGTVHFFFLRTLSCSQDCKEDNIRDLPERPCSCLGDLATAPVAHAPPIGQAPDPASVNCWRH